MVGSRGCGYEKVVSVIRNVTAIEQHFYCKRTSYCNGDEKRSFGCEVESHDITVLIDGCETSSNGIRSC